MPQSKRQTLISVILIFLLGASMRCSMSCVGPLTGAFQADLGLSSFAAGFVTTIPLISFSVTAPFAGKIAVAVESKKLIATCYSLVAVGLLLRAFGAVAGLYTGTLLLGLAIGTLNVLMPALIRKQFPHEIGLMMGVYLCSMTAASSFFSGTCQSIAQSLGGWQMGLAAPVVLVFISIAACLLSGKKLAVKLEANAPVRAKDCINRKHVAVAVFMGTQSFFYFSILAWLPSIAESFGGLTGESGLLLLVMQACGLIPCLGIPIITQRTRRRDLLCFVTALQFTLGFLVILFWGSSQVMIYIAAVLLGFACSATLSISLTIIAEQGRNAAETAMISALSQCIGYACSAIGPTVLGYLFDLFGKWEIVLILCTVLSIGMTLLGLYAGKRESVRD